MAALVEYSDSGDDEDKTADAPAQRLAAQADAPTKRKREADSQEGASGLPPLPASFFDVYTTNPRVGTTDNPSLHGGRRRAVPHVEGNWPSHVYLEWIPLQTEADELTNLINAVRSAVEDANKGLRAKLPVPKIVSSLRSEFDAPLPLHISLSRTLQIRTDDRDNFLETLNNCLQKAAIKTFPVEFAELKWVPNYQRNRWFLVLSTAKPPDDELNRLLNACNEAARRCGHPGLYTGGDGDGPMEGNTPRAAVKKQKLATRRSRAEKEQIDRTAMFHITIAWNLEEPAPEWLTLLDSINLHDLVKPPKAPFDVVKAKIGNVVHNIELGARRPSLGKGGGLLGL
ncbi:hypothetical protein P154DRAFT_440761 [Amniculicola lignicola CBS 123094]|uniref:U6 snRNA phosphodiesterase n=1 Tax=Amniculicola lignicola CBS 123094 TaxID=1392246 RepID=A0A6A5W958_9PLEO|nr:hypothetical protein P154DRAFT_440761 [Amniculicola lignicola CBS 123094]